PSFSRRACSVEMSEEANEFVKGPNSSVAGRGFFFGGISPLLTRSCTSTQAEKFVEFAGSNLRAVRSRPPFFTSPSWHSKQCFSRNWRLLGGKVAASDGNAIASSAQKQ